MKNHQFYSNTGLVQRHPPANEITNRQVKLVTHFPLAFTHMCQTDKNFISRCLTAGLFYKKPALFGAGVLCLPRLVL